MFKNIRTFLADESGATAIEYGLIAALISVAALSLLGGVGDSLSAVFGAIKGDLDGAVGS